MASQIAFLLAHFAPKRVGMFGVPNWCAAVKSAGSRNQGSVQVAKKQGMVGLGPVYARFSVGPVFAAMESGAY